MASSPFRPARCVTTTRETLTARSPSGEGTPASGRPRAARFGILALVFAGVVINYIDRGNLALVAPAIAGERGFSSVQVGWVLSAFGWAYAIGQLPGGWLVDRVAS